MEFYFFDKVEIGPCRRFFCEFCKMFENSFSEERRTAASKIKFLAFVKSYTRDFYQLLTMTSTSSLPVITSSIFFK